MLRPTEPVSPLTASPVVRADRESAIDADDTLTYVDGPLKRFALHLVAVTSVAVYAAYLGYRGLYTVNAEALGFSLVVYFAEIHGFFSLLFYFHQTWTLRRRHVVPPQPGRAVDVFITTYDEEVDLLRQTVRAALAMRYPHTTWVLDDGRRPEVRALCAELGARYLTREDNEYAKAGNWNNAFAQTQGELIATFDADHVPRADFLERTLGFFRDPKVALVQVPQHFHNVDSVQHRVNWKTRRMYSEQDVFFQLVMPGKDHWNAAFFCGTGAVLRRQALEPHGGILMGTITEDLHTSVALHSEGWKSVYLNEMLVTGLAPMDLHSFETQRLRWAEGNLRTTILINPLTTNGLTLAQRLAYLASLYHWTIGIPKLIFYLAPPWILFSGRFPIANFDGQFLLIYLLFLGSLITSYQIVSRGTARLLMDELFNMVSFFTLLRAMKRFAFGRGRPSRFHVTPKTGSGGQDRRAVLPHMALIGFSALAIVWSVMGIGFGVSDDVFGAGVATFWTVYNMTLLCAVVRLADKPAQKRRSCRFRATLPVELRDPLASDAVVGVTADISEGGCTLLWPTTLPTGTRVPLRVHLGTRYLDRTGEVVANRDNGDGWTVHRIRFAELEQHDIDLLSDAIHGGVVHELFALLSTPSRFARLWRFAVSRVRRPGKRSWSPRRCTHVPVRVGVEHGAFLATTRDISRSGLSLVAPRAAVEGTQVSIEILAPRQRWRGDVKVARCIAQPAATGFATWVWGLRFEASSDRREIERIRKETAA